MRQVLRENRQQLRVRPRRRALIAVPVLLGVLAGCGSGSDSGDRAATALLVPEDVNGSTCADLLGRLPDNVLGNPRDSGAAKAGFASWGDPAVMLWCGAAPSGPTTDECIEVDDVAWVFREADGYYEFLTYGRAPAVLVQVPDSVERTQATGALVDLNDAVAPLEQTERRCYDLADTMPTPS